MTGTPAQSLYYGPDQIGSVRRVFASASSAPAFSYDAYGNALQTTAPLTDFNYAGMFFNAASGLYLTQYRAYNPAIGRWLSRDPLGERSDAYANLYPYVGGNPLSLRDPNGNIILSPGTRNFLVGIKLLLGALLHDPDPNVSHDPGPQSQPTPSQTAVGNPKPAATAGPSPEPPSPDPEAGPEPPEPQPPSPDQAGPEPPNPVPNNDDCDSGNSPSGAASPATPAAPAAPPPNMVPFIVPLLTGAALLALLAAAL